MTVGSNTGENLPCKRQKRAQRLAGSAGVALMTQKVISRTILVAFNALWPGEPVTLCTVTGFAQIVVGRAVIFTGRG